MRQFAGSVDLWMAGQNLFDQRAAGTRHAENEDRRRRRIAHAGKASEQVRVERVDDQSVGVRIGRFVIFDFAASEGIALEEVLKGAWIIADVFQRLAQGKMDELHLRRRDPARVGGQRLEGGQIGIARAKGL